MSQKENRPPIDIGEVRVGPGQAEIVCDICQAAIVARWSHIPTGRPVANFICPGCGTGYIVKVKVGRVVK